MQITSADEAYAILAELEEEALVNHNPIVVDSRFAAQTKFINDPAFRKAAQCTRRAGKSNGVGRCLFKEAYAYPGCSTLYLALTRQSAKNIMWKDVIKTINRDLRLGGTPNEAELTFHLPNGSQLMFAGADATRQEMEKYLGGKYRCVIVDEAGSFRQELRKLIYENLEPAVSDYDGWVGMIGTATEITNGLFFDVTTGVEPGWSVHKWMTTDNPYMREKWLKRIALLKETNPRVIETPAFRRMYLNEWVIDTNSLCYKFNSDRNEIELVPDDDPMTYVLGIDLGFEDSSAFVISAFNEFDRNLYFVETYKRSGMIISDVVVRIQYYIDKYKPIACVIDNASKQSVEEMKQRYHLPLIAADKHGKPEFIEIMNSEFIQGYIKLVMPACSELATEYGALIWDEKKRPKREEHPNCDNHLCFVEGTKIRTLNGQVSIEKLKIGDLVSTRKGPRRIKNTINRTARIITLLLSNGVEIKCTPDHPFWSKGKWVKARNLNSTTPLLSWQELKLGLRELDIIPVSIEDIKAKSTSPIKIRKQLSNASISTGRYGKLIMEGYLTEIMSIIRMGMLTTIGSAISKGYPQKRIIKSMLSSVHLTVALLKILSYLQKYAPLQRLGINHKPVTSGIESMADQPLALSKLNVPGATRLILNPICQRTNQDAVALDALPPKEGRQVLMMNKENVHGAKRHSQSINTDPKGPAPVSVLNITDTMETKRVFNLTVEEEHEYFAGDVLVSNCDAALYNWRHCFQYLSKDKPAKKSDQEKVDLWFEERAEQLAINEEKPFWERDI